MSERIEAPITPWDMYLHGAGQPVAPQPPPGQQGQQGQEQEQEWGAWERRTIRKVARRGLDIRHIEYPQAMSDITGESHTLYAIEGGFEYDGYIALPNVQDVAIVGKGGASIPVPSGNRGYDIHADGGNFYLSCDFDQTADGAWGRFWASGDNMIAESMEFVGSGRPANPNPSEPLGYKSGPAMYMPAASDGAVNYMRDVTNRHGGVMADEHFGDRPSGMWYGRGHSGILRIQDSEISEFPNNGIYASASPGTFEIDNTTFDTNGVSAVRLPHGYMNECHVVYNSKDTGLSNADTPDHASLGIAVEQKKAGVTDDPAPKIQNCTVELLNVPKTRGAITTYQIYRDAEIGLIDNCRIVVNKGAGRDTAHIYISGSCDRIEDCTFAGDADLGVSVDNNGPMLRARNNTFNTPPSRENYDGPVR